jgi:ATP-dependent DNA helicase RecG
LKNLVNSIQSDNWKVEVTKSLTKSLTKSVSKSVSKSKATFGLKIWQLIQFISTPGNRHEIFKHLGVTNHSKNKSRFIDPLIEFGWLEMTIPDKPNSRLQQYKLTDEFKKRIDY